MQFTKLRLNGFKSFVDPTDLVISEGLTGVVGPNGCGKSNLLEALRWVMGENRPTAMRGGGMEDVIFAGAASRPARNFAEVALMIDNSDRLAPAGFNESDLLEVTRRITRDVGSAYKANTKDMRARDVQMLFADASTGAHSPALVRQGQIAQLINSKPKARRRVLEEAAGISGLYQRRHEAELKLKGAETNLARVDDVLEQLASQLAQLARQARQAARYREIGTQLRRFEGLLLYRRWKEADETFSVATRELTELTKAAAAAETGARQSARHRQNADEALPPKREEEAVAAAVLQRLQVQRDALGDQEARAKQTISTLEARFDQLKQDITREAGLNKDAVETIERLEWEAEEIAKAGKGHEDRLSLSLQEAQTSSQILQDRETELSELTEDVARLAARHQSARRFHEDCQKTLARNEAEAARASSALGDARAALDAVQTAAVAAKSDQADAINQAELAEKDLAATEITRSETQAREVEARSVRSEAVGEANALKAEVDALTKLVARESSEDAQVLDLITVAPGYEKALGAALADDLRAPLVADETASGWIELSVYASKTGLPSDVEPLSEKVNAPSVLNRRLDQIGVVSFAQGHALQQALQPGQRLVSLEGDLWRWDGYRTNAEDAPSATAMRLEQINRLSLLREQRNTAESKAIAAEAAHADLSARLADLTRADQKARQARREADQALNDAVRKQSRAEADQNLAESKLEALDLAVSRHQDEARAAQEQLAQSEAAIADLGDLTAERGRIEDLKMTVEAARITMLSKRSAHDEVRREGEARTKRSQEITKETSGWRHRLSTAEKRSEELATRLAETEEALKDARSAPRDLATKRDELAREIATAETRRQLAADNLSEAESVFRKAEQAERDAERSASEVREARARAEARTEAAKEAVQAASDRIQEEQEVSPEQLLESLDTDPDAMPAAEAIEVDVLRFRRQRDALGAVNLRAEEDAQEVQSEHDTLAGEKIDLEEAIKTLRNGIASLNKEGRERLLAAFDEVNTNFGNLFTHLFGGGEAKLVLVESDDPLEAGLEIMCQPPGKKLSTLSLLSGGEQTLTALALIFAVFLANPAPICVLDEVDAPLDDMNVNRFCDMLDEMTRRTETRFLVITHHAVTMSRMDRLFGVTMGEPGVSQLVSVDLKRAEALVA